MKVYIVYLLSMENSPEVTIQTVTADKERAEDEYKRAKALIAMWRADDPDSDCWAEAHIEEAEIDAALGDTVWTVTSTCWYEVVSTGISAFLTEEEAKEFVASEKTRLLAENEDLMPFDEDEALEESMHLCDESVMVDYYFMIESYTIK